MCCSRGCVAVDVLNKDILNLDLTIGKGSRDNFSWLLAFVVNMIQRVVQLEVWVGNGAGAEKDGNGN